MEFALVAPVLILLLVALADFGLAARERMLLASAARAGTQYAYLNPDDAAGAQTAASNAARFGGNARVAVSLSCECPDGTATVCGGNCQSGTERQYLTVTVTEDFITLVDYPGIDRPLALSAQSTLRIR